MFPVSPVGVRAPSTSCRSTSTGGFFYANCQMRATQKGTRMSILITCVVCGIDFPAKQSHASRRKTCSKKCNGVYMAQRLSGANGPSWKGGLSSDPCVICGKSTPKRRDHIGKYRTVCSKECKAELMRRENSGEKNGMYKGLRHVRCSNCGEILKRYPCHADSQKHFFCNAQCQGEWRKKVGVFRGAKSATWTGGDVTVHCAFCSNSLRRGKDVLRKRHRHFCNHECYGNWMSAHQTGINSPSWRGGWQSYYGPNWHNQRKKALERDGHKCQICGKSRIILGKEPDVHHIRSFREYGYIPDENENYRQANRLSNLISLCPSCHHQAEHGKVAFQPKLL